MMYPDGLPRQLAQLKRTLVMGVVNVTPDSFSDGGKYLDTKSAIKHGLELIEQGADIVDVGGESTRPGSERVSLDEELSRTIAVVEALCGRGFFVSIDTMRAEVARAALKAGACVVNDVSGGKADSNMFDVIAGVDVPYVLMHWRGYSDEMDRMASYDDVVLDVCKELLDQCELAEQHGIARERLVLDPGIGFAKNSAQNWALLGHLEALQGLQLPLLIGASRKRFLGELLADGGTPRAVHEREAATVALTTAAALAGVWAVRVHDVRASRDAVEVVARLQEEQ